MRDKNISAIDYFLGPIHKKTHWIKIKALGDSQKQSFDSDYGRIDVKGKVILDIGAEDANTAVYFLKKGATRIYAYELQKKHVVKGKRVISDLELRDKIELYNKRVGRAGISLNSIIKRHKLKDAILKMDIEGDEYNVIFNCNPSTFYKAFELIVIEYHYGYVSLHSYLKKAGYSVSHTIPISTDEGMNVGMLYAQRAGKQ